MRIYTDIVGDLFHWGHVNFLRQARALGDFLMVGITPDEAVLTYKRKPILQMEERVKVIEACRYVDLVVPNCPTPVTKDFILANRIDLVVHGDDFDQEAIQRWYNVPLQMGIFRTIPRTPDISTSEIIERILARA